MLTQLQAILDNASVGIAFVRNERFELVGPSLAALTGCTRDALRGMPLAAIAQDPIAYDAMVVQLATALARQSRVEEEIPIRRKDGSRLCVRVIGSAIDPRCTASGTICPEPVAHMIAERLRRAVRSSELQIDGRTFTVGASIGLSVFDARKVAPDQAIRAADQACYAAKRAGRGAVRVCYGGEPEAGSR
jgi:PAS domain S-box-containing protein